nr:alpha/beta fold hydrolase [Agrobacterium tumefaciens]
MYPYAGGSVSGFRSYARSFPIDVGTIVPIEIPGRGTREAENYALSIEECALRSLTPVNAHGGPYILHGHCMGALLVVETMQLLIRAQQRLPDFIIVSGRNSPEFITPWSQKVADLNDQDFFSALEAIGGVPRGLNFAMGQSFLKRIRHDQAMARGYTAKDLKMPVPILVLGGKDDEMTTQEGLEGWRNFTSSTISIEWMHGAHYFILDRPTEVADAVERFWRSLGTISQRATKSLMG